jgi:UDP-N-acetylglucosamine acyltransferase
LDGEYIDMASVAPTAIVDKTAQLGNDVRIGPGCVIEGNVVIGDGCELQNYVIVCRGTRMGSGNRIFSHCVIGGEPQILGVNNPDTQLVIGNNNIFREYVNINRGSPHTSGKTIVGNNNFIMVGCHLGHDCEVEDNVVMVNHCQIGGHNKIERNVWLSAYTGIHQFVTVGRFSYTGGLSGPSSDVPPFMRVASSYPCAIRGLNTIGLRRAGISEESIDALDKAYRRLYRRREAGASIVRLVDEMLTEDRLDENVKYLLESLQRSSQHRMGRYRELFR